MFVKKAKYHHGSLRDDVLRVGREHLARLGPVNLSLREVARELKVSPAAPYRHFADKDMFLDALAIEGWRGLTERLKGQASLRELFGTYRAFATAQPELLRLMFSRCPIGDQLTDFYQVSTDAYQELMRLVGPMLPSGSGVKAQYKAALAAWALIHGLTVLRQDQAMGPFIENIGLDDAALEGLLRGGLKFGISD
jgi:AcrR family transcriptional regulator